jgi:hypothetical protein
MIKMLNIILHIVGIILFSSICIYGVNNGYPDFHLWKMLVVLIILGSILTLILYKRNSDYLSPKLYFTIFITMAIGFSVGSAFQIETIEQESKIITREVIHLLREIPDLSTSPRLQSMYVDYSCLRLLAGLSLIGAAYALFLMLFNRRKRMIIS